MESADVKIILLAQHGRRGDARKVYADGFSGYLNKPVHQTRLYEMLLEVTGIRKFSEWGDAKSSRELPQFDARVLVVEDNITNQRVARGMLNKLGIQTEVAENGKEAIERLQKESFDLVLMDGQMPVMNGFQATRAIRDEHSAVLNRRIVVVALTANAMQSDRNRCLQAGMNDFLSKPINLPSLVKTFQRWLPSHFESNETERGQMVSVIAETDSESVLKFSGDNREMFDYSDLLKRMDQDEEVIQQILEVFLLDIPERIKEQKSALSTGDDLRVAEIAHSIKGTAANLSAGKLTALAKRLEQAAKIHDGDAVERLIREQDECFDQLQSIFSGMVKQ
jgi:CheY-like chemotaxis protein